MPPKFSWSFSALNDFDTCPYQYAQKRYYKTQPPQDSDAIRWGVRVHSAAEKLAKGEKCDDAECEALLRPFLSEYLSLPRSELLVEKKLSVTAAWTPTGWAVPAAWGRGIVDLAIIDGAHCLCIDYKTGKPKPGTDQLKIFAVLLALHYPEIQIFNGEYLWLKDKSKTKMSPLLRRDLLPLMKWLNEKIKRVQEAWEYEIFAQKRNGLCKKWCPCEECPHCGGQ